MQKLLWQCLIGFVVIIYLPSGPLLASELTTGTYKVEGGTYQIQVQMKNEQLFVVEPNKKTSYQLQSDGSYHFYNEKNDTVYGFRVIDANTIEAFKPHQPKGSPTRLILVSKQAEPTASPDAAPGDAISEIARKYEALSKSDPVNAMTWTSCAAAAQARATHNDAEFAEYAKMVVSMLKPLSTSTAETPCEDAIPQKLWQSI